MGCLNAVGEFFFEAFGTDQQKQKSLQAIKDDMDMALALRPTTL